MNKAITIAIADSMAIVAEMLAATLSQEPYKPLFHVASATALLDALARAAHKPGILILDTALSLPGFDLIAELKKEYPGIKILFLYAGLSEAHMFWLIREGGRGFLPKSCTTRHILKALDDISASGYHFSKDFSPAVLRTISHIRPLPYPSFSATEYRLMPLFCHGLSNEEAGGAIGISVRMARKERQRIMQKIPVRTFAELMHFCISHGIFPLADMYNDIPRSRKPPPSS